MDFYTYIYNIYNIYNKKIIYFLFEKQAFNGLLKVISKQIYLQKMIERNNNLFHINVIIQCTFYIYVIPKSE